ncbi:MAG: hypothetical protein JOZ17_12885 [Acetobacteraceae bacterium]|nr:hypothetical protein [Acetobacteraceae bacterium]
MPIEIRELIIRAVVDPSLGSESGERPDMKLDREALIQACVDETLRILRRAKER